MNQCVPSYDLDDSLPHPNLEVEELTLENGEQAMHDLGPSGLPYNKPLSNSKYTLDRDHKSQVSGGTLESIVNQATSIPHHRLKSPVDDGGRDGEDVLMRWFDNCLTDTITTDALVPSSTNARNFCQRVAPSTHVPSTCLIGGSVHVNSCNGAVNGRDGEIANDKMGADNEKLYQKKDHNDIVLSTSKVDQSMSGSATSRRDTIDTGYRDLPTERITSTYMVDDRDSICHSIPQEVGEQDKKKGPKISTVSTKRSRAAATHNKSERKRRDKINERMKTLQKLVPNSSKTNKASMLDEVIEYMKQLQAQVQAMSNTMICPMMLPMAVQQQLQMSMMEPAMKMRMAALMDINALTRPNVTVMPSVLRPTTPFMPIASRVSPRGHVNAASTTPVLPNPLSTFQSQPMTVDGYSKTAAMYQQYLQPSANAGPRI